MDPKDYCDACKLVVEHFYEQWTETMAEQVRSGKTKQGTSDRPASITYDDKTEAMASPLTLPSSPPALIVPPLCQRLGQQSDVVPGRIPGAGLLWQPRDQQRQHRTVCQDGVP